MLFLRKYSIRVGFNGLSMTDGCSFINHPLFLSGKKQHLFQILKCIEKPSFNSETEASFQKHRTTECDACDKSMRTVSNLICPAVAIHCRTIIYENNFLNEH